MDAFSFPGPVEKCSEDSEKILDLESREILGGCSKHSSQVVRRTWGLQEDYLGSILSAGFAS